MSHKTIEIRTDDGTCPAHVFEPAGAGPHPGVLFYMDGIGMRPALLAMAQRLANAGYHVLAPNLFYRLGEFTAPDPKKLFSDEATRKEHFAKVIGSTSAAKCMADTRAFLEHLPEKIGVTGYCMGGRMALAAAGTYSDRIVAAAAFHPGNIATDAADSPHLLAGKIKAKVYVAGAMEDPSFDDAQKQRLEQALTEAHVDHTIETYPARHGWVPSDTPVHDTACAERHWKALLDLFEKTLR